MDHSVFLTEAKIEATHWWFVERRRLFASLIRQASRVIAHDSGAMHIAAAFKRPVMSVWGNTIPEFGMGPYVPTNPDRARIAQVQLPCRPCSKIGHERCPEGHFRCMEDQDLVAIATFAAE